MKPWTLSKTLDPEVLRHLVVVKHLTDQQIADMYDTKAPTIRYHRLKANPPITKNRPPRVDHKGDGAIPWTLDAGQGHHMDPMARLLRNRNRMLKGLSVPSDAIARVEAMERHLREHNMVINYSRERGFYTMRRNPKIDAEDSIVRMPTKPKKTPQQRAAKASRYRLS